jgi:peptide/nickel transport system permease protein
MYAGRIVEQGDIETVLNRSAHPYTRALLDCAPELGRPDKALAPIEGQPPPLDDLPPGCHFAPRCGHARDKCRRGDMALRALHDGHEVRCVRAEEIEAWRH